MGFNYAKEKAKFEATWRKLQKEYEESGMTPESIQSMHTYDWEIFLSRRIYENHTQLLPDTYFSDESAQSSLLRKFELLTTSFDETDFPGRYAWVDTISIPELSSKLKSLSAKDLELLTFLVIEGHDQCELSRIWGCSQAAISQRFKKIKKFLK